MHAALAIAPVILGNAVPQIGIPASVGGDETFGHMLRSVEADEAATNPDARVDVAIVTPKHLAVPRSSGPPVALPALLPSFSQGTKPARIQMAVSSADADGIVGPATATAPVLGEAATAAGAVPAAPVAPGPEAFPAMPVVRPQAVAISGATETGASADASPAEAAGVSAAGGSVASFGAAPGKDAATPSPPEINLPLPLWPTSIASATAAGGSTPLPRAVSAPTADEARTLSAALTVSAVAASKPAVSTLNVLAALPRRTPSSPDVGTPVSERSASSSSTAPISTVRIPPASTPVAQRPIPPAAVAPTPTLAAALGAASILGGSLDSVSPSFKSPAIVGPTSIGRATAVPTSVVPAVAVRRIGAAAGMAPTSDETGAPGPTMVDSGVPIAFPVPVASIDLPKAVLAPVVRSVKSTAVSVAGDDSSATGATLANVSIGLTAALPIPAPVAMKAPTAIPASIALGRATVAAVPARMGGVVPAANAAREVVDGGLPAAVPAPAGVGKGMPAAVPASSGVTNQMLAPATAAPLGGGNGAPAAFSSLSVVSNRVPGAAWASAEPDSDVPAALPAPATTGLPPAPPTPAEPDVALPASAMLAEEMSAGPAPSVAGTRVQAMPVPSVPKIEMPVPAPSVAGIGVQAVQEPSVPKIGMPAPMPAPSVAGIGVQAVQEPSVPKIGMPAPLPARSVADIGMQAVQEPSVPKIGMPAPLPARSVGDIGMQAVQEPSVPKIGMPAPLPARSVADIGVQAVQEPSVPKIGMPAPLPARSVADIGMQAVQDPSVPKNGMPAPLPARSAADIGMSPMPSLLVANIGMTAPLVADIRVSSMPVPSVADIGILPTPALSAANIGMPAPKPAPSVSDIETPAAIPAPSAVVNRMPDAVAVRAAAGNELPAPPLAPALAMVATQLPAAVRATEPPSMLRKPAPLFVGPLEADELTVAGVDRNRPPVALAVEGPPDPTLASAADPGIPQQRTRAAASVPLPSSAPEAPPMSYQPPTWSQAPAPEAAKSAISTTDLKGGLHAVDPSPDTASKSTDGEKQIEQTASPNTLSSLPTTSGTVAANPPPSIKEGTHAAQILPTVIMLAKSGLGGEQMTVRLHPAELGMVQVRIERAASGAAHIELTADDPRTLQALQQDQSALHRALDGAGIPAAGRTLTFHAGQPPPVSTSSESSEAALGSGQHPSSGRGANGNPDAGRFAGGGRGSYSAWETTRKSGGRPSSANATAASATPRVYRAGLDITA